MLYFIGIDPGVSGGVAVVRQDGVLAAVLPMPTAAYGKKVVTNGGLLAVQLKQLIEALGQQKRIQTAGPDIWRGIFEHVHAMPKQGVSASFTFGHSTGSALTALQIVCDSVQLVTPAAWKRAINLSSDKGQSINKAKAQWPQAGTMEIEGTPFLSLKKHEGMAEAALLAEYGRQVLAMEQPSNDVGNSSKLITV